MDKIIELMKETKYYGKIKNIYPVEMHGFKYNDLYKLEMNSGELLSLKIRPISHFNIKRSIELLKIINGETGLIIGYLDSFLFNDKYILITKWIEGIQPTTSDRMDLP